jgi:hypothetical protein
VLDYYEQAVRLDDCDELGNPGHWLGFGEGMKRNERKAVERDRLMGKAGSSLLHVVSGFLLHRFGKPQDFWCSRSSSPRCFSLQRGVGGASS